MSNACCFDRFEVLPDDLNQSRPSAAMAGDEPYRLARSVIGARAGR